MRFAVFQLDKGSRDAATVHLGAPAISTPQKRAPSLWASRFIDFASCDVHPLQAPRPSDKVVSLLRTGFFASGTFIGTPVSNIGVNKPDLEAGYV